MAAHHLHDQVAVVALRGGVQAVDRLGGDLHRCVEAERLVGAAEVVVDRLRDPDDREAEIRVELRGRAQRVLAADGDQAVELMAL